MSKHKNGFTEFRAFRLDFELATKLGKYASRHDMTEAEVIRKALEIFLILRPVETAGHITEYQEAENE